MEHRLTLYGYVFGESGYFHKGSQMVTGRFDGELFSCISKSGSQNLWLPFLPSAGLKIFHPQSPSGSSQKATTHFAVQQRLFDKGFAPKPLDLLRVFVTFESLTPYFEYAPPKMFTTYGIMMERVFSGGYAQISRNLEKFGVGMVMGLHDLLLPFGSEALTLREYGVLCRAFGGDPLKVQELINDLKAKVQMSALIDIGCDLFTPSNIVLDHFGECKLVDFDHCNI